MNAITITFSDDRLAQLQELAARFRVSPEELRVLASKNSLPDLTTHSNALSLRSSRRTQSSIDGWRSALPHFQRSARVARPSHGAVRWCGGHPLLRRLGFDERIRGDHHIFTKTGIAEILNLQPKGSKAKPYQVKQVRGVIVKYRLAGGSDEK
jgi:hypothetical protein